ncbi:MAG: hypothetical protein JWQ87_4618 [Candidatus Sulfotelmatobacter sp.]|jgi:hypothetical protein|nr:hypothetical protein [Candidatus Sulfotelmatobacter sp.]
MFSQAEFPHRHNKNGSHDLICTKCLMTVASVQNEMAAFFPRINSRLRSDECLSD